MTRGSLLYRIKGSRAEGGRFSGPLGCRHLSAAATLRQPIRVPCFRTCLGGAPACTSRGKSGLGAAPRPRLSHHLSFGFGDAAEFLHQTGAPLLPLNSKGWRLYKKSRCSLTGSAGRSLPKEGSFRLLRSLSTVAFHRTVRHVWAPFAISGPCIQLCHNYQCGSECFCHRISTEGALQPLAPCRCVLPAREAVPD